MMSSMSDEAERTAPGVFRVSPPMRKIPDASSAITPGAGRINSKGGSGARSCWTSFQTIQQQGSGFRRPKRCIVRLDHGFIGAVEARAERLERLAGGIPAQDRSIGERGSERPIGKSSGCERARALQ